MRLKLVFRVILWFLLFYTLFYAYQIHRRDYFESLPKNYLDYFYLGKKLLKEKKVCRRENRFGKGGCLKPAVRPSVHGIRQCLF